jgi:hypothetical protein
MRRPLKAWLAGAVVSAAMVTSVVAATPASAAVATFPVMNTSESPPDGVWFRNSPQNSNTNRETGFGIYAGESLAVDCYSWGDPVGQYSNHIWYRGLDVQRPTVNGHANYGWMNTHYVNDGQTADHAAPGVPDCNAPQPPPTTPVTPPPVVYPEGGSVYYSPYPTDYIQIPIIPGKSVPYYTLNVTSPATKTLYKPDWVGTTSCSSASMGNFTDVVNGKRISTLSGWSSGRRGPTYFVRDSARRTSIHYLVLFDPGTRDELKSDCNWQGISIALKNWLALDTRNQITIFAGAVTRDYPTRVGTYAHQGLQQVYFPAIRNTQYAKQVTVCNYDKMVHTDVWIQFRNYMNYAPADGFCPAAPNGTVPNAAWHP